MDNYVLNLYASINAHTEHRVHYGTAFRSDNPIPTFIEVLDPDEHIWVINLRDVMSSRNEESPWILTRVSTGLPFASGTSGDYAWILPVTISWTRGWSKV